MIWNNIELFNVAETELREDGALLIRRFPQTVLNAFDAASATNKFASGAGRLTTGCEIRFVGEGADILISEPEYDGSVEIYRGDFCCRVEHVKAGALKRIELRKNTALETYRMDGRYGRFSPDVWRVIFDHDYGVAIHEFNPVGKIRPPKKGETPEKKILAYGSSITHSAGSVLYTNSYIYTIGKGLGADVLCKGMGGSCHIEKEVADYICKEEWDVAVLELGINMVGSRPVAEFEERARYLIKKMQSHGKPVVLISNFTCFHNFPIDTNHQTNEDFVACLEKLYNELKSENLYYIKGQEIVTEWDYLSADLLHPSPYGHGEMGRKIAKKIRDEFRIL